MRGGGGNCGTGVWPKFLKPIPIIYLVTEKIDPFIYLIDQNIDPFIYCPLISIPIHILIAASEQGENSSTTVATNKHNYKGVQQFHLNYTNYARKGGPLIYHTGNLGLFIYCCVEKMGPFVYFYLKIEAYPYTGEAEKGGYSSDTSLLCHI